ncbi:hypothetical protein ACSQ67_025647 [Phaseolus vulgaris]
MEADGKIKKGVDGRNDDGPKKKSSQGIGEIVFGVTIARGGVLPNINHVLLPKKIDKASKEPKSPSKAIKSPKKA